MRGRRSYRAMQEQYQPWPDSGMSGGMAGIARWQRENLGRSAARNRPKYPEVSAGRGGAGGSFIAAIWRASMACAAENEIVWQAASREAESKPWH